MKFYKFGPDKFFCVRYNYLINLYNRGDDYRKLDYLPRFNVNVISDYIRFGQSNYWETDRLIYDYLKKTNETQLLDWFVNKDMYWTKYMLAGNVIACGHDRADLKHFMSEFDANQRRIDSLKKEANKIHELGLIQQSLFFLYDAILVDEGDRYELAGDEVSELISTLENLIFQNRKVSVDIEKKLRRVSSYALDNNNARVTNEYKNQILLTLLIMFNEISYDEAGLLKISKIKNSVITKLNEFGLAKNDEKIINKLIESIENFLIKLVDFVERDDRRKLIGVIKNLQMEFIEKYELGISADELINYFPNRDKIENFLVTSELVFNTLSIREDKNELDFSPAIISLTKAMELIMNWAFAQMEFERSDIDEASARHYFNDNGDKKESITLGPCINLLKDSSKIIVKDSGLEWGSKFKSGRGTIESRFEKINKNSSGKNVYHFDRLNKFKGLKIKINYKKGKDIDETEVCFTEDSEQNRLIFIKGLEYIKDNYRNKVAHKDGILIDAAAECRELMIQTQNLLWILMYLLIEE